jgi:hypothetical protein
MVVHTKFLKIKTIRVNPKKEYGDSKRFAKILKGIILLLSDSMCFSIYISEVLTIL